MGALSDGRFWFGLIVGVGIVYGWHYWQAKKAS